MGIDESEVSRLLRGEIPADDPAWGEVSSFLKDVGTAYRTEPTAAVESRHLAAVAREARLVRSELRQPRQSAGKRLYKRAHRVLAGSVGAALVVLTAGVGVASALGINPLEQLIRSVVPSMAPQIPPTSPSDPTNGVTDPEPGTASPGDLPSSTPGQTRSPNPASTKSPGAVGDEHKSERATVKANNGKATAKPTPPRATPTPPRATPTPPRATPTPPGKNKGSDESVGDGMVLPG